jgi:hypothetical protein
MIASYWRFFIQAPSKKIQCPQLGAGHLTGNPLKVYGWKSMQTLQICACQQLSGALQPQSLVEIPNGHSAAPKASCRDTCLEEGNSDIRSIPTQTNQPATTPNAHKTAENILERGSEGGFHRKRHTAHSLESIPPSAVKAAGMDGEDSQGCSQGNLPGCVELAGLADIRSNGTLLATSPSERHNGNSEQQLQTRLH